MHLNETEIGFALEPLFVNVTVVNMPNSVCLSKIPFFLKIVQGPANNTEVLIA